MKELDKISKLSLIPLYTKAKMNDFYSKVLVDNLRREYNITVNYEAAFDRGCLKRGAIFDYLVSRWIVSNPEGRILNIGCGFCTRFWRLDNGSIYWIDSDFSNDILEVKKETFPKTKRYETIAYDLRNSFHDIGVKYDLVIAEGVLMYLPENRAKHIVSKRSVIFDAADPASNPGGPKLWSYEEENWKNMNISERIYYKTASGLHPVLMSL